MFLGYACMSPERVSVGEEGDSHIPCRWTKDRKGVGTNSRESGARDLDPEHIRIFRMVTPYLWVLLDWLPQVSLPVTPWVDGPNTAGHELVPSLLFITYNICSHISS